MRSAGLAAILAVASIWTLSGFASFSEVAMVDTAEAAVNVQTGFLQGPGTGAGVGLGALALAAGAAAGALAALGSRRTKVQARAAAADAQVSAWPVDPSIDMAAIFASEPKDLRAQRLAFSREVAANPHKELPRPKNDTLLKVIKGEPVDHVPKWMMRQAGRYLPEFRAIRAENHFFQVCRTPALAAEVTLQPLRRYPSLDAGIIFSDILVIPEAMGMECEMVPGQGPQLHPRIASPADMARLRLVPAVEETLGYVMDAIFLTNKLNNHSVPILGFCGAPWTLFGYMVEGGGSKTWENAKLWMYDYPQEASILMRSIANWCVDYLVAQYDAGAPVLQVFDTNAGMISPELYHHMCMEDLLFIADEVKKRRPKAILMVFTRDLQNMSALNSSAYDGVSISWTTDPADARKQLPDKVLQGNLDPSALFASPGAVGEQVHKMISAFGTKKYIANLGHGMMPNHNAEQAGAFIDGVDRASKELMH